MDEERIPILVANGQCSLNSVPSDGPQNSYDLLSIAVDRLVEDAGIPAAKIAPAIDVIACPQSLSAPAGGLPAATALAIGAQPSQTFYSTTGGNTPQWFVNRFSQCIARGEMQTVLMAGLEMLKTATKSQMDPSYLARAREIVSPKLIGDSRAGTNAHEVAHGLSMPVQVYPLFENALRAHYGNSIIEHQNQIGQLYAQFSQIASQNPHAWFPQHMSVEEIVQVTEENRYIGFPYTKFMNPIIGVNQAAACLLTSVAVAKKLGIPSDNWIAPLGIGDCHDHWFPSERANYYSSPAIHVAAQSALRMAQASIEDIDYFDLYSCFPSAVQIARDEIGLSKHDHRSLTVTGGLRFAGGPGNNYPMHSIAAMMNVLRADPKAIGLVSGLGWNMTKHSYCVYSHYHNRSGSHLFSDTVEELQAKVDALERVSVDPRPAGSGTVETYTLLFDRTGHPTQGVIVGRLENGQRFLANTEDSPDVFSRMMHEEIVGQSGRVKPGDTVNQFYFT